MSKVYKILFITLSNIGDVILTLPVLDYLRESFPESRITVMVAGRPKEIFENNPFIERVIVYDKKSALKKKIDLFHELRREKFDIIIDLKDTFYGRFLPAAYKAHQFLLKPGSAKHMRQVHLLKILYPQTELGKLESLKHQSLYIKAQDLRQIEDLLKDNNISDKDKIIVVSSGARSEIKRWPKEKFVEVINRIGQEYKAKIILIGDKDDIAINKYIASKVKVPVLDLSAKTTILQAAALLKKSALLITNDSANLHLASYLDLPIVAIFGPTDDVKYGPWSRKYRLVKKEIFCRPCMEAQCRFRTLACMHLISVEDVLRQVRDIWSARAPERQSTSLPKQYKRILIVRTDKVGDVILSTPVIKSLRDAYPYAYIAIAVRPYTRVIVEGNPCLDEIILYDKDKKEKSWLGTFSFARKISGMKFDLAVVLNPSNRSNLIPFLAGIPKRVGYDRKLGFLLTDRIKDTKHEGRKHEIEYNLDLIRQLGIEPKDKFTFMPVNPESEKWAEQIFEKSGIKPEDKVVVLNPGASDNSKIWPAQNYAEVGDRLAQNGYRIVVLGAKSDSGIAQEVIKGMHSPVIDMVGNNNISQAASFLRRCSLFISTDTGPMHIASSIGVPVIAILGRSQPGLSPARWGPHNKNSIVLHKDVGCIQCQAHNCQKEFLCLKAITVEDVIKSAETLLAR